MGWPLSRVAMVVLPDIPKVVQVSDLKYGEHEWLVSEKDANQIIDALKTNDKKPPCHYNKAQVGKLLGREDPYDYGIFCDADGAVYVLYSKHPLGKGNYGKSMAAQNIATQGAVKQGAWSAVKSADIIRGRTTREDFSGEQKIVDQFMVYRGATKKRGGTAYRSPTEEIQEEGYLPPLRGYFAMPYYPGKTLTEVLASQPRFSDFQILDIACQVAAKLVAINEAKYSHNDLHGGNILYDVINNRVSVIDFGKATKKSAPGQTQRVSDSTAFRILFTSLCGMIIKHTITYFGRRSKVQKQKFCAAY